MNWNNRLQGKQYWWIVSGWTGHKTIGVSSDQGLVSLYLNKLALFIFKHVQTCVIITKQTPIQDVGIRPIPAEKMWVNGLEMVKLIVKQL